MTRAMPMLGGDPDEAELLDAGPVAARMVTLAPAEVAVHARVLAQARARHAARRAGLGLSPRRGWRETTITWLEGWVDFLDTAAASAAPIR